MKGTFTLGRIAGVRVAVHWSVVVIFLLVTVTLAGGRLVRLYPDYPTAVYWVLGLLVAVVFVASILAHEVAHAIVARRNGIEVEDMTLWMLGGVARLRSETPSPGVELRVAGVGPLTSAVLGVLFAASAVWLDVLAAPGPLVEAVAWLAAINILLALFNSIPAAPLDGGRLLRAVVWKFTGDPVRSTVIAAAAGRGFGWLLVAYGFLSILVTGTFAGLWMALIGGFLIAAATAEGRQAQLRGVFAGIRTRDIMTPHPVTVPATTTVEQFLAGAPFGQYRHTAFPVVDAEESPVGLVTVARVDRVPVPQRGSTSLAAVMAPIDEVTTAFPDEPVTDVLSRLAGAGESRVLVLDRESHALVGIVSQTDISRAFTWLTATRDRR
ncbi:site-2 protease family protein [Streptomyces alkaliterrae]|uniref:Zinc metalloprotease n=1 Tax=Streptomyces alkaliterrae TaxID=2213162 RepID=A0A5P0YP06_9ACTN|nr:site-2 protease family protein [Streptomyces alkaliterrae]MBB1260282.1 site-2 protease family protein [Streptomyces alkaliterrae]MQS02011.1 CBS domain-containing protein [Streptomyces alkaliterrae]